MEIKTQNLNKTKQTNKQQKQREKLSEKAYDGYF